MLSKYIQSIEVTSPKHITATLKSGFRVSTDRGLQDLIYLLNELLCPATSQYETLFDHTIDITQII